MTSEKPTMIEFKDVHKYYGDYHALRGITATLPPITGGCGSLWHDIFPSGRKIDLVGAP